MPDPYLCERRGCGHAMNLHNPCNAKVVRGKKERLCGCEAFLPEDRRRRMALLTDTSDATLPKASDFLAALENGR